MNREIFSTFKEITKDTFASGRRNILRDLAAVPDGDPRKLYELRQSCCSNGKFYFLYGYARAELGPSSEPVRLAHESVREYFFGKWRSIVPSGDRRNQPPDPEYFHQQWDQHDEFLWGACLASVVGDWELVERLAEYLATINWREMEYEPGKKYIDLPDGREESAFGLLLASVMYGLSLETDLEGLVGIVSGGRSRRHRHFLGIVEGIEARDPEATQSEIDDYCDFYLKTDRKPHDLTRKVMIEGTLLINYARHVGLDVTVPEKVGAHYIQLTEK